MLNNVKNPTFEGGAKGNGLDDDSGAIQAALKDAIINNKAGILIPRGTYRLSKPVRVQAFADDEGRVHESAHLTILGESGSTLRYCSNIVSPCELKTNRHANHSAIVIKDSSHIDVIGLGFEGDHYSEAESPDTNVGAGVYITNSSMVRLEKCRLDRGGKLFEQEVKINDFGLTVLNCDIFGAFCASNPGRQSLVQGCRFEQPPTTDYDRIGEIHIQSPPAMLNPDCSPPTVDPECLPGLHVYEHGSSHALYIYGGSRDEVRIIGNHFRNIRTTAVKVSGTNAPANSIVIANNTFEDCGNAFAVGADDGPPITPR